jgi:hypothetical protein
VARATWEAEIRRIAIQDQPGQIVQKAHLQNYQSKMDWRYDSSSRTPSLQAFLVGLSSNPSPTQKNNNKKKNTVFKNIKTALQGSPFLPWRRAVLNLKYELPYFLRIQIMFLYLSIKILLFALDTET